jgi:hypothetical protein
MDISSQEQAFFQAYANLLKKYRHMNGKFGLWRVHQHHTIGDDELLHEVSDPVKRTSTIRVIKKNNLPDTAFASQWLIKANGTIKATVWCCDP